MDNISEAIHKIDRFLGYRFRTEKEIREKLKSLNFEPGIIDGAIERLIENHIIDDLQFAKAWARERFGGRSGLMKIKNELRQKGVRSEIIEEALGEDQEDYTKENELKNAEELLRIKYKNHTPSDGYQKEIQFIIRKGYPYSTAKEAVRLVFSKNHKG